MTTFNLRKFKKMHKEDKENFRKMLEYISKQTINTNTLKIVEKLMEVNNWSPTDIAHYYLNGQGYTEIMNILQVLSCPNK